jgi:hypothetical protein
VCTTKSHTFSNLGESQEVWQYEWPYNNTNIKGKRWGKKYEKDMKRLEDEKLSHYLCFKYQWLVTWPRVAQAKRERGHKTQVKMSQRISKCKPMSTIRLITSLERRK